MWSCNHARLARSRFLDKESGKDHVPLMARWLCLCIGAILVTHCTSDIRVAGFPFHPDRLADITPRKSNKADVQEVLGSPSHIPAFNSERWYYVYREVETIAFLDPETTQQIILAFDFDDKNRVKDVFLYTKEDNKPMQMVERITPSQGQGLTFFDQLLESGARLPGTIPGGAPQ